MRVEREIIKIKREFSKTLRNLREMREKRENLPQTHTNKIINLSPSQYRDHSSPLQIKPQLISQNKNQMETKINSST